MRLFQIKRVLCNLAELLYFYAEDYFNPSEIMVLITRKNKKESDNEVLK